MSEKWNNNDIDELLRDIDHILNKQPDPMDDELAQIVAEAMPDGEELHDYEDIAETEPEIEVQEIVEPREPVAAKPAKKKKEKKEKKVKERPVRETKPNRHVPVAIAILFAVVSVAAFGWAGINLHTAEASATSSDTDSRKTTNLSTRLDNYAYNVKSDAVSDLTYIRKIYTIAENATVAPKPNQACYGETDDPQVILDLIDRASELLDGQSVVWNPDLNFVKGKGFRYYYDDTILALTWWEDINGRYVTCAEVKIADASQLRRKLSVDTYDSGIRTTAREMAAQANAVIAMNADFYAYRNRGITVYQRTLYRCNGELLDTCFFNTKGEMIFVRMGELMDRASTEQFIADNDILFSTSFGPVLIEHGEPVHCGWYPIGEIDESYSRAGMGMVGDLHYFYATINFEEDLGYLYVGKIYDLQNIMISKGCYEAYTMDGGQTAEICMNGDILNHIDYGAERQVSDIIYFATAIPDEEGY